MSKIILVTWSPQAEYSYLSILIYIIENWSVKAADNFNKKTENLISKIKSNNSLCPKSNMKNLRKCVITHQSSMIYRVNINYIEIVDFVSNYSLHKY